MIKRNISASQIDLFANCKRQWKYRYLDRLPEDDKFTYAGTLFGTAFHKQMESLFGSGTDLVLTEDKKKIIEKATAAFREDYIAESDKTKARGIKIKLSRGETAISIVDDYTMRFKFGIEKVLDSGFFADYDSFLTEEKIEFDVDEFHVNAILDLVGLYKDGSYDVLDFKTGSRFDPSNLKENTQLLFYTMAGYRKFGKVPNRFRFLVYDRSNMEFNRYGTTPGDINEEQIKLFEEKVKTFRSGFAAGTFDKRDPTQKDFFCNFCGYKKTCKSQN